MSKSTEELETLVIKAGRAFQGVENYDERDRTVNDVLQFFDQELERRVEEAELKGAINVQRILRNSPDPRTDIEKYIRKIEQKGVSL